MPQRRRTAILVRGPALSLACAALAGAPAPSAAQDAFELRFTPFVGALDPRGELPHAGILSASATSVSYPELEAAWAVGGALDVVSRRAPLALRMGLRRSLGNHATGQWGCAPARDGGPVGCPDILILIPTDIAVTLATADLVAAAGAGRLGLEVALGLGHARYGYDWDPRTVGEFSLAPGRATGTRTGAHLGLGLSVELGPARWVVHASELFGREADRRDAPARVRSLVIGARMPLSG